MGLYSMLPETATGGISRDLRNCEYEGHQLDKYGRINDFKIFSCARPWNRAFHFSWLSFFVAFTGWFSLVPALEYLVDDQSNDVTLDVKKTSNIISVLGTIFVRFALGPICERWGARRPQANLLIGGGILVMLSALVNSSTALYIMRFLIGIIGGAFVPCQYWTTMMFGTRVVGSANAFAGGWGNLGGGWALFFVGSLIKAIRKSGVSDELAWRYAMITPGLIMIMVATPMIFLSDDCPQGHWDNRLYNDPTKKKGKTAAGEDGDLEAAEEVVKDGPKGTTWAVVTDYRVWLMAIIYACCFGVELSINNSISSYLFRYFNEDVAGLDCSAIETQTSNQYPKECSTVGLDTSSQIASLFGLMNIFARALGGIVSDYLYYKFGMRGRLAILFFTLVMEGIMLILFSQVEDEVLAIVILVFFSTFVQASEGCTFALVPFINRNNVGNVVGIVGAGGNIGAVTWSTMFKEIQSQRDSYLYLAFIVIACSFTVMMIPIQGVYLLGCDSPATAEDLPDGASEMSTSFHDGDKGGYEPEKVAAERKASEMSAKVDSE